MIFRTELAQRILEGRKRVTRRAADGPCRYTVGKTYAIQPGRGKHAVGRIEVVSVRREELGYPTGSEALLEGFDTIAAFGRAWSELHGGTYDPKMIVDRIEFKLVKEKK